MRESRGARSEAPIWHEISNTTVNLAASAAVTVCGVEIRHGLGDELWRLTGRDLFTLERTDRWRVAGMTFELAQEFGGRSCWRRCRRASLQLVRPGDGLRIDRKSRHYPENRSSPNDGHSLEQGE